jgi:DNA-binding transcriptional ArsR family regulator
MSSPDDHADDRIQRVSRGDRADRGARWNRGDQPGVDAQILTDLGAEVYEAVATLEYSGRSVTRDEVMQATDLDDATVSQVLDALTDRGVLIRTRVGDSDAFELARRDWSATPETRSR